MTTKQAIETLESVTKIMRGAEKALDAAGVATGNEHREYQLDERIKWLADVKDCFGRQVYELRALIKINQ